MCFIDFDAARNDGIDGTTLGTILSQEFNAHRKKGRGGGGPTARKVLVPLRDTSSADLVTVELTKLTPFLLCHAAFAVHQDNQDLHMTIMTQNNVGTEAMASTIRGEQILSLVSAVSDGYLDMLFRCITLAILATLALH